MLSVLQIIEDVSTMLKQHPPALFRLYNLPPSVRHSFPPPSMHSQTDGFLQHEGKEQILPAIRPPVTLQSSWHLHVRLPDLQQHRPYPFWEYTHHTIYSKSLFMPAWPSQHSPCLAAILAAHMLRKSFSILH